MIFNISSGRAEVPGMFSYQGQLTDMEGNPLDGTFSMLFAIYGDNQAVDLLWSESHPDVVVSQGLFNVILGSYTPLPCSIFPGEQRWLGIALEGEPVMMPLTPIISTPYAIHALQADTAEYARNLVDYSAVGIGADHGYVYYSLLQDYRALRSQTIEVPGPGNILAIASAEINANHMYGSLSSAELGIAADSTDLDYHTAFEFYLSTSTPSGAYKFPVTCQNIFPVTESGSYTISLWGKLADTGSSGVYIGRSALTLLFIPTAYGSITNEVIVGANPVADNDDIVTDNTHDSELSQLRQEIEILKQRLSELENTR